MTILRYTASADNTITNTFVSPSEHTIRATGSNMGQSDILETFSIYGRRGANNDTSELSRILIKFPIDKISADRTAGKIPAVDSVKFILKMYNAKHTMTTPNNYDLLVSAVSSSWEEGTGLDMATYSDKTSDGAGSNWINANANFASASATITALSKTAGQANTRVLAVTDSAGNSVNFSIDNSLSTSTATKIAFSNANSNANQFAANIVSAINLAKVASTLNVTASASDATVTLKQMAGGFVGNSTSDIAGTAVSDSVVTIANQWTGGNGKWTSPGGDYHSSNTSTQTFEKGFENLELDVTTLVEQWVSGLSGAPGDSSGDASKKNNYGFGIRLSNSYEAYYTGSEAHSITNSNGPKRSYYTKTFFGRGTEFFYKRPVIEAQFDERVKDDKGRFYVSSSLLHKSQCTNDLYFYNYYAGKLYDIRGKVDAYPTLKLYHGISHGPSSSVAFKRASDNYASSVSTAVTATRVSQGIYKATVCLTAALPESAPYLYDVWSMSSTEVLTGSAISPITFKPSQAANDSSYVISMPNLKKEYKYNQKARLKLYTRYKNWSPNIYSVAKNKPEALIIPSASYRVLRSIDDYEVVPYGYESAYSYYSMLSYDVSGNYFDLSMDLFEIGYQYTIKFAFYDGFSKSYIEQPYEFKFRVTK